METAGAPSVAAGHGTTGSPRLPAFLMGGLALSGRFPLWVRFLLGGITAGMAFVFVFILMTPAERIGLPLPIAILGFWILQLGLAVGGAELFRSGPQRGSITPRSPSHTRLAGPPSAPHAR